MITITSSLLPNQSAARLNRRVFFAMYFDRFDICEAHYMFAMLWHDGMWGEIYSKFGQLERMQYRPSPCLSEPKDLSMNGREIYRQLVVNHCGIKSTAPKL
jgi:hypothetical protein